MRRPRRNREQKQDVEKESGKSSHLPFYWIPELTIGPRAKYLPNWSQYTWRSQGSQFRDPNKHKVISWREKKVTKSFYFLKWTYFTLRCFFSEFSAKDSTGCPCNWITMQNLILSSLAVKHGKNAQQSSMKFCNHKTFGQKGSASINLVEWHHQLLCNTATTDSRKLQLLHFNSIQHNG